MASNKIPFAGSKEQEAALMQYIAEKKDDPGCLMPILQKAQEIYGYLPIEVQTMIADELHIPLEKVYGVVTFYAQFALNPKGRYKISVCLGTACYVKGSGDIFNKLQELLGDGSGGRPGASGFYNSGGTLSAGKNNRDRRFWHYLSGYGSD